MMLKNNVIPTYTCAIMPVGSSIFLISKNEQLLHELIVIWLAWALGRLETRRSVYQQTYTTITTIRMRTTTTSSSNTIKNTKPGRTGAGLRWRRTIVVHRHYALPLPYLHHVLTGWKGPITNILTVFQDLFSAHSVRHNSRHHSTQRWRREVLTDGARDTYVFLITFYPVLRIDYNIRLRVTDRNDHHYHHAPTPGRPTVADALTSQVPSAFLLLPISGTINEDQGSRHKCVSSSGL